MGALEQLNVNGETVDGRVRIDRVNRATRSLKKRKVGGLRFER